MQTIVIILFITSVSAQQLIFLIEIFRHGARSPVMYFRPELEQDTLKYHWPGGLNNLTEVGTRTHYILGQGIRKRYIDNLGFLSSAFNPDEIDILAMNVKRTFDSANAHLTGMFPPGTSELLTSQQASRVRIPVNFPQMDQEIEELRLNPTASNISVFDIKSANITDNIVNVEDHCKGIVWDDNFKNPEFVAIHERLMKNVYKQFTEDTNFVSIDELNDPLKFHRFFDDLVMNERNTNSLPDRFKEHFVDTKAAQIYYDSFFEHIWYKSHQEFKSRAAMSRVVRMLFDKIERRIELAKAGIHEYSKESPKMFILSEHDNTLVMLQRILRLVYSFEFERTDLATNILLELTVENGSFDLTIIVKDKQKIKDSFENLKRKVENWLLTDQEIDEFCGFSNQSLPLVSISSATSITLLAFLIIYFFRGRNEAINDATLCEVIVTESV